MGDTGDLEVERSANASVGYDAMGAGLGKNEKETTKCDEERIVLGIGINGKIQVAEVNLRRGGYFSMSLFIKSDDKWIVSFKRRLYNSNEIESFNILENHIEVAMAANIPAP